MAARIIIAEDDAKQAELIQRYLERDGHETVLAPDGRSAIDEARRRAPDLLILDLMLPKVGGLDVCRVLRAESNLPIIMLTASAAPDDLLLGLELGADDYLTKPFNPRELLARVRTVLRRAGTSDTPAIYQVGDLRLDPSRYQVTLAGRLVPVTPAEFKILSCLAASPGKPFTRRQLIEQAFGFDHLAMGRTVDVHVMNLRKKLEVDPTAPDYLQTVYGVGYKLTEGLDSSDA